MKDNVEKESDRATLEAELQAIRNKIWALDLEKAFAVVRESEILGKLAEIPPWE